MATTTSFSATVFVVDTNASDYTALMQMAASSKWKIRYFLNARDVLRLGEQSAADLWIVNIRLPDMSGFDLVEMIKPRLGDTAVFMVTDRYRDQDEVRALSLGITKFLCKPLEAASLRQWHPVE